MRKTQPTGVKFLNLRMHQVPKQFLGPALNGM